MKRGAEGSDPSAPSVTQVPVPTATPTQQRKNVFFSAFAASKFGLFENSSYICNRYKLTII